MKKIQILAVVVCIAFLVTGILAVRTIWLPSAAEGKPDAEPRPAEPTTAATEQQELPAFIERISGPFTHKNLTFYLVHGPDTLKGETPLSLEEAMQRNLVAVHETGEVNELYVENTSRSDEVFIQAGDIVRGGQQDRMLAVDLIVPARSGRMPIDSFCVESGRWNTRGTESRLRFNSSSDYAPSKDLKMAAKHSKSQGEVWEKVEESQNKLSAATNSDATSSVSRSSLPLTMENPQVRYTADDYARFLEDIVSRKSDIIGIVMVINGRINSADTYASTELFVKLWPKLLKAASIEAVAESSAKSPSNNVLIVSDIVSFLDIAERSAITNESTVTERIRLVTRESDASVFLTSLDGESELHRSYLAK